MGSANAKLFRAARDGDLEKLREVLKHPKVDLNVRTPSGETALELAAAAGFELICSELIKAGCPPSPRALNLAAINDFTGVVKILVEAGTNLSARDSEGRSPLHHAVISNQISSAAALLISGADPNAVDIKQRTPLHEAHSIGMLRCLLEFEKPRISTSIASGCGRIGQYLSSR